MLDLHGSVAAVAAALHVSPSAVSQQLKKLAQEVGAVLVEPEGRTVRLTPAGRALLDYAHRAAEDWELVAARLAHAAHAEVGRLRCCGFATGIAALLTPATARVRDAYADVTVELVELGTAECLERLVAKTSDSGLVSTPGAPSLDDRRFDQQVVLEDPQDLVVPSGHPLAARKSVQLEDLARQVWVTPHEDQRQLIEVSCAAAGFTPDFAHRANEWDAVLALVEHGMGVCLLPRLAPVNASRDVQRVPVLGRWSPVRQVVTCVRRGSTDQPLIRHALTALHDIAHHQHALSS